ncbi:MAG: hypothetical protein K9J16_11710 [Melioribacteraceae bacterium]|nr:hypothetical protein [Melioribacteraceae bacterium]MCF8354567.1 hypothetical protein [Melioribacteraceae bacterium]MCF8394499.1 hypothetical protein [Melioribacteraceae bacterium]MCF8420091.1 hypothetical protein [Melioribacteraceae bacterium]
MGKENLVFYITKEDIQYEAMRRIGREISEKEFHLVKKGLEGGLLTGIDIVYGAIFEEIGKHTNK